MAAKSVRQDGPELKGPFDFPDSPLGRTSRQPLLLGVFLNIGHQLFHLSNEQQRDF